MMCKVHIKLRFYLDVKVSNFITAGKMFTVFFNNQVNNVNFKKRQLLYVLIRERFVYIKCEQRMKWIGTIELYSNCFVFLSLLKENFKPSVCFVYVIYVHLLLMKTLIFNQMNEFNANVNCSITHDSVDR